MNSTTRAASSGHLMIYQKLTPSAKTAKQFIGFPAIVDEGQSVGVRIFDTQTKAALSHQDGLVRLLQLQLRKDCTYILKNMPQSATAMMAYNRLPAHPIIPARQAYEVDWEK